MHVIIFSKWFVWILLLSLLGCNNTQTNTALMNDNLVIESLYLKDIEIRELDAITDTVNLERYDKVHREQIFQLLANNDVKTPLDKIRSAWILQHTAGKVCDGEVASISPENYLLAYKLSSSALMELRERNDTMLIRKESIPRIVALNYDRYLLFSYGYQKYGTQFVFDDITAEMLLAPIDTSLCNDTERRNYQIEPLDSLLLKYKMKAFEKGK